MTKRRQYVNPPIEEAICEVLFEPNQDWNDTIRDRIRTILRGDYPDMRSQYRERLPRVQFVSANGTRLVGVGPGILSVHMLRPYQAGPPETAGWDEFRRRISAALDAYWQVVQPIGVTRIGIWYVNKILAPRGSAGIKAFLKVSLPALPHAKGVPNNLSNFKNRAEFAYRDGVRLVTHYGSSDAPRDHVAFDLRLDVIWESTDPIARDAAMSIVDDVRGRQRRAFEAVITDTARTVFDEE